MKSVAIIQARMGSSRLPGKVLLELAGVPVVKQVYERVSRIDGLSDALVATTVSPDDDPLVEYCRQAGIPCFRGSEEDVLDRYYQAGVSAGADLMMRITADCPFIDPKESGRVLQLLKDHPDADYATNCSPATYPDGLDTDVTRWPVLESLWKRLNDPFFREHVTYYIPNHADEFEIVRITSPTDYSAHRWTLDEPRDYDMLSAVADELAKRGQFGYMDEILAVLHDHPEIVAINQDIERNEGVARSLERWRSLQAEGAGTQEDEERSAS